MIPLNDRIESLAALGKQAARHSNHSRLGSAIALAHRANPWFTPQGCAQAIESIARDWLTPDALERWVAHYPIGIKANQEPKRVAVIMAGNVPFVGFHDMLCVLIAGHAFVGKLSSKDGGLMQALAEELVAIDPRWAALIEFTEAKLPKFDAVIATGSSSTARHFEHYFREYPRIIRGNRHSIGVLSGLESEEELGRLADDIFTHFGLGCRSVSKVLIPERYNLTCLMDAFAGYSHLANHHKWANNYEYHRAIFLMNAVQHLDNGFTLLTPSHELGSPLGVLYYQTYHSLHEVNGYLTEHRNALQCVVSNHQGVAGALALGMAQQPSLTDYADGIDTLAFLNNLA